MAFTQPYTEHITTVLNLRTCGKETGPTPRRTTCTFKYWRVVHTPQNSLLRIHEYLGGITGGWYAAAIYHENRGRFRVVTERETPTDEGRFYELALVDTAEEAQATLRQIDGFLRHLLPENYDLQALFAFLSQPSGPWWGNYGRPALHPHIPPANFVRGAINALKLSELHVLDDLYLLCCLVFYHSNRVACPSVVAIMEMIEEHGRFLRQLNQITALRDVDITSQLIVDAFNTYIQGLIGSWENFQTDYIREVTTLLDGGRPTVITGLLTSFNEALRNDENGRAARLHNSGAVLLECLQRMRNHYATQISDIRGHFATSQEEFQAILDLCIMSPRKTSLQ